MKRFLSFLITMILITSFVGEVYAVSIDPNNEIKSKTVKFNKDMKSNRVFGSNMFYFDVDSRWQLQNVNLNLVYTPSQIIDKDISTLTVLVNGNYVYSTNLKTKTNYKELLKINIPLDYLRTGSNDIEIKTYKRITGKSYQDDINSANWVLFHEESFINLNFKEKQENAILRDFPYPFLKASDSNMTNGIIVVPDKFTSEEASVAIQISSAFGAKRKNENIDTRILKYSDLKDDKNSNLIFISSYDSLPKEILNLLTKDEKEASKTSTIVKITTSPYNKDKKILIITSKNKDMLSRGETLLNNKDLLAQVKNSSIVLKDDIPLKDKKIKKEKASLKDLGYGNTTLRGAFTQKASFMIPIQKGEYIKEGAILQLNTMYSKNIDFDKSLISVYINDTPIGSKKLSEKDADNDVFQIPISKDISKNNNFYEVNVEFDLQLKNSYCNIREENTPWAYISNDSYLKLPYENKKEFTFENYPFPFVEDNNLIFVIPDKSSSRELTWLGNTMIYMASYMDTGSTKIKVLRDTEISKEDKKDNLIILGSPNENVLIKELNKNMYIKYNKNYSGFESNDKVKILDSYGSRASSIQLISSPYNSKSNLMIVTAVNEKDIKSAERYLKDINLMGRLKGNAALIDTDGEVQHYYFGKDKDDSSNKEKKSFVMSKEGKKLTIFLTSLIIILVFTSFLYLKKYKKNKQE